MKPLKQPLQYLQWSYTSSHSVAAGDFIMQQGDVGDWFYVVKRQEKFPLLLTVIRYETLMHVGEKIFRKGQVGDDFYNINAGKVKITDISLGDAKYVDQILNLKDDGWATGRFDIEMGDNP